MWMITATLSQSTHCMVIVFYPAYAASFWLGVLWDGASIAHPFPFATLLFFVSSSFYPTTHVLIVLYESLLYVHQFLHQLQSRSNHH